jgi:DNA adenine methylase
MKPRLFAIGAVHYPPLLKWPGGKRNLIDQILPLVPPTYNRYFEPFLGGGALFFALQPRRAHLSDKNADLMLTYSQIRDCPDAVIRELKKLRNTEENYYSVRSSAPLSNAARAARLIYLITLSFNGIYRVNLRGTFNVPYGRKTHLVPCDAERIRHASALLRRATLYDEDFERVLRKGGWPILSRILRKNRNRRIDIHDGRSSGPSPPRAGGPRF